MTPGSGDGEAGKLFARVLEVVGAGAALVGWVAVVGAAREWARFHAAGVPSPAETASLFPREALIGEGLSALAPLLILGIALGAVAFARRRIGRASISMRWLFMGAHFTRRIYERLHPKSVEAECLLAGGALIVAVLLARGAEALVILAMLLVLLLLVLVVWFPSTRGWTPSPLAGGVVVFLTLAVVGGIAEFLWQISQIDPKFDSVVVTRHQLPTVTGYYITQTSGDVYVAVIPQQVSTGLEKFAVLVIPNDQVETITIGPEYRLTKGAALPDRKSMPPPHISQTPTPQGKHIIPAPTVPSTTPLPPPPVLPTPSPTIRVAALDEVVPTGDHFCFPVGTAQLPETMRLTFSAPSLRPASREIFATASVTVEPGTGEAVRVTLSRAFEQYLRRGSLARIEITITATTAARHVSGLYSLFLQEPGGKPLRNAPCVGNGKPVPWSTFPYAG